MLRTSGGLCWFLAIGFGLPDIPAIISIARGDGVWSFLGFPTYGSGPFEQIGVSTTVPLLVGFLAVAIAEMITGLLLWRRTSAGSVTAIALLPFELAYWIGFALPIGPIVALARTVVVVLAWRPDAPLRE